MAVPSPAIPLFSDGMTNTVGPLNDLTATFNNLYAFTQGGFRTEKPLCVVYRQKTPGGPLNATDTLIAFDTVYANTDFMFVTSKTDSMLVNTPGWYRLSLQVHYDATPNGVRACKILVNGTAPGNAVATDCRNPVTIGEGTTLFCSCLVALGAGAQLHANVYQNSGGTIATITTYSASFMSAEWISPL